MSYPLFPVVSKHLYVPPIDEIENRLCAHLLRMGQNLDPSLQVLRPNQHNKVVYLADRAHKRLRLQHGLNDLLKLSKEQRLQITELARAGATICGPLTTDAVDEWAAAVHARTPWMGDLTTLLMKHMRSRLKFGQVGLSMPPLLLVGKPGNGKSWYAEMIGALLGAPVREIDVGSGSAGFRVAGTEKGWGSSGTGIPVEMMLEHRIANPVIVVNEVCKAGQQIGSTSGSVSSITTALLQVLEPETAARFECPALRIRFDMSRVNWILTANDLDNVPAPLRDRCRVCKMPDVTPDIAALMFETVHRTINAEIDPQVVAMARHAVITAAGRGHVSLRQIRRIVDTLAADPPRLLH